ncbi:MAG TPA: methyltransferase domain-containing protein [Candidatus Limnocylindria bacterium]|nr:methyltransferase domain-containing protein [Candidatus Limnocylindria bacterium]
MSGPGDAASPSADPAREPSPSACCAPADPRIARRFDELADAWAEADELPEMVDVSARLLDLLRDAPGRRPSVLELGCGSGGLSVALLEMGAERVTGIDLSASSVRLAEARATDAGFGEQATFRVGNAADADAAPHDWVVLDRVVCCFGEPDRLIQRATELATECIALTAPESRGWRGWANRLLWAAENVWDLVRGGCRGYVHDLRRVERRLAEAGFRPRTTAHMGLWHVATYERR